MNTLRRKDCAVLNVALQICSRRAARAQLDRNAIAIAIAIEDIGDRRVRAGINQQT
ncbi:hypothetical protein [Paraburkholderia domus]|uniref:hypothetical protein n=1 Tax=Paraburkholderia domus TaxID=2793075 RepID=UPI00191384C5|nr:hypothetical protein [Paraburkholderia domus]MBK5048878.1 hypothetical protein [Burkholderia sp. R-70006]MBK5165709.1 hypothetical protein [Burkholderia sp. R-70211]